MIQPEVVSKIETINKSKPVVIYMKGTKDFPRCGFSANAVNVLRMAGVAEDDIASFDILEDPEVRQGIKEYSNWPTIPQVYVKGQFIGGSDIVAELYQSGELQKLVQNIR